MQIFQKDKESAFCMDICISTFIKMTPCTHKTLNQEQLAYLGDEYDKWMWAKKVINFI